MTDNGSGYETTVAMGAAPVREIIGREVYVVPFWKSRYQKSVDETQADYTFWDKFRRGKAEGYQSAGAMAKAILDVLASWVAGDGFTLRLANEPDDPENEADPIVYTNDLLSRWSARIHAPVQDSYIDALALGDQYWIVNPDSSLSYPTPDIVEPTLSDLDYRQVEAFKITTRLPKALIVDEYRPDGRTITVTAYSEDENGKQRAGRTETLEFRNLIGRLPVIHHANDRGSNELYGRPVYEGVLHLLSRYDDVLEKMLDGVELMGNPIPTFEGMESIQETIDANATIEDQEYTDVDGNDTTRNLINFDSRAAIFVGKGGSFNFKAPPGGFTSDARNALKALFLVLLDYTRIPEAVWGNELTSSRASAGEQMKPFYQYITWRRKKLEGEGGDDLLGAEAKGGLLELADVWLRTRALTDPRIVVGPVVCEWPPLAESSLKELGEIVALAHERGWITGETALRLLDLVENPRAEVEEAQAQMEARQKDDFAKQLETEEAKARIQAENAPEPPQAQQAGGQESPQEQEGEIDNG